MTVEVKLDIPANANILTLFLQSDHVKYGPTIIRLIMEVIPEHLQIPEPRLRRNEREWAGLDDNTRLYEAVR
jgi:hypothetical protein